jgi:histidine triad (HIT) family protein
MAADCIFCLIAAGKIPSHKILDDAKVLSFLDIKPLARGHLLVIPKAHYPKLEDVPASEASALMAAVQKVSAAVRKTLGAPATTIAVNNGKEAGQEVPHVHFHIVPRSADDGFGPIHALFQRRPPGAGEDLGTLSRKIQENVGRTT